MNRFIILIVGALLLIALVSALLHRRAKSAARVRIDAPRARVWETLTDIQSHPRWLPQSDEVEPAGERRWRCLRKDGIEQRMEIAESVAQRRAVWRFTETHKSFDATWAFELEEEGNRTTVRATQSDDIPSAPARVISLLRGGRDVALREFLENLKIECERDPARA